MKKKASNERIYGPSLPAPHSEVKRERFAEVRKSRDEEEGIPRAVNGWTAGIFPNDQRLPGEEGEEWEGVTRRRKMVDTPTWH